MELTPELQHWQQTLRRFLAKETPPDYVREMERRGEYPYEAWQKFADFGLLGVPYPEEYGGMGGNIFHLLIVAEELSRTSGSFVFAYMPTISFCAMAVCRFGSEEQRHYYLPAVAAGECRMAIGLTEPDAGSDLASLRTSAREDGDDFVVNGGKMFTTGAQVAHYILLFCRTGPESRGFRGVSVLLIPTDSPGISIQPLETLAGDAVKSCAVQFDDVRVPRSQLLGGLHEGWEIVRASLDEERIYMGAQGTGNAQGAFGLALAYAKERQQFGQPIGKFQAIAHMLAEMATEIEAARCLTWRVAWLKHAGVPCHKEASIVKVFAGEVAMRTAVRGMQVMGGYSYVMEVDMQRYFREAKVLEIAGGTNQVQRNIIAEALGL